MAVADVQGLHVAIILTCAFPHKVTLVEATLERQFPAHCRQGSSGTEPYSDALDERLAA
jgi:hypothetical protein